MAGCLRPLKLKCSCCRSLCMNDGEYFDVTECCSSRRMSYRGRGGRVVNSVICASRVRRVLEMRTNFNWRASESCSVFEPRVYCGFEIYPSPNGKFAVDWERDRQI